ncbi:MAG: hypothetical protein DCF18_04685 [Cyanobium sp.]|uniref:hypothetical protein n=1 Tax=Synechococcus sp. CS-1333 TaxID=2848638 RepID=UPI000DBBEF72|nr:hypothetical protein [Synechococcus sp. CS-1333]MCT0209355.1 hypothetical protein [Synechococcus sp. CS-1333]PZV23940.1 MAG: hypothetical protein DCF18_04685 [Cyanobium sp.]
MLFKRKGSFFIDFDKNATAEPVTVAPVTVAPAAPVAPSTSADPAAATAGPAAEAGVAAAGSVLTTAEAMAAELRREQDNLPPPSLVTFSPDCLTPAGALSRRRRLAGANIGPFKAMAASLMKS